MNEIRVKRMLLGGCATFVAWVVAEIMIEGILSQLLFGDLIAGMWQEVGGLRDWKATNILVSTCLALGNSTLLIWLYASLRPMYGVGTKTAIITSAFGIVWGWLLVVNAINLGLPVPRSTRARVRRIVKRSRSRTHRDRRLWPAPFMV
jgi:hypothetical protein